jgi:N-acetylglucosaminyldiphosphoundecaprenol N-acetyl-beta-D-mannosaminyltransferase
MDPLTPHRVQLLGVEFDNASLQTTVEQILSRPHAACFAYVVTPNADHIERLRRLPSLGAVYQSAMLCLLDSQLIGNCAHYLGMTPPNVVTGADLTQALLARLHGMRVAVIGMQLDAFAALTARYPQIEFLHHNPPMGLLNNAPALHAACDFACNSRTAFTFIALGSPVQELLAHAISTQDGALGIGLCIGSGLAFCAGTERRAPLWMRRRGLEWLHRLIHDPFRLAGRYLISDPKVLLALFIEAFRQKTHRSRQGRHPRSVPAAISASGPCPPASRAPLQETPRSLPHGAPRPAPPPAPGQDYATPPLV